MVQNVNLLFVTSRQRLPDAGGVPQFGDSAATPVGLWAGRATISGISQSDPDSGNVVISDLNSGGFSPQQMNSIANSSNDVVIFIHGTDNPFDGAIARAAYNSAWLNEVSARPLDVIAYTWPSRDYKSLINVFDDHADYLADQQAAVASAPHFGLFLDQLHQLKHRLGTRRLNLLCHSMGNFMLAGAVETWLSGRASPSPQLFDQVVLAAADETKQTFLGNNGKRLSNLKQLAHSISVYFNYNDIMMGLSEFVNKFAPLGQDGATGQSSTQLYPKAVYQFLDCTNVNDYIGPPTFDESHQYYRQSPGVRRDIAGVLIGHPPTRYFYDASGNIYWLFPAPIPGVPSWDKPVAGT